MNDDKSIHGYEPLKGDPINVKVSNPSKYKKELTNVKQGRTIKSVRFLNKRKDDKTMTEISKPKKPAGKKFDWRGAIRSVAWLVEAAFRGFVGWILLSNFDSMVATAAAIYALGTAGLIVATHFIRAHRK